MSKYQISMVSSICTAYKDKFMCTAYKDKFMKRKGFPVITIFTDLEKFLQVCKILWFYTPENSKRFKIITHKKVIHQNTDLFDAYKLYLITSLRSVFCLPEKSVQNIFFPVNKKSSRYGYWCCTFKTTYMLTLESFLTLLSLECGHLMTPSFGAFCFANVQSS